MKYCFCILFFTLFLSNVQANAKETMTSNLVEIKPPNLDSSLFHIMEATKRLKDLLAKFPADGSKMDETSLLMSNISFTLTQTIVLLSEDDLRQSKTISPPEFLALWHFSIADCKIAVAEFAAKTGDEKTVKKYLPQSTPHLQDVNAYFLDYPEIKYFHLGKWVIVTPKQQKEVIARHIALSKKKK
jgi:hypothetical protein